MARISVARVVAALAFAAIAACMQVQAQATDHTTYVVSLPGADRSTLAKIEAAGGVTDHFDGGMARVYVHRANWEAFLATGVPYTVVEVQPTPSKTAAGYPSYDEVGDTLQQAEEDYPDLVRVISLGQ